ncbi:energy-converting hydrogenase A, subunit R [Methanothermobacter marburgensis]|uniref:energy-converting hydrogenase A, subunit R n=1 Tax=Methanothermobacter marburgensis TaxID=145263 RepID=UPI0035BA0427
MITLNRVFVTDCEGPVSLNDNAFEAAAHFMPEGDRFFRKVSEFDDILADEIKRPGYNAGDTLKLIVPFLLAYGVTDEKLIEFSEETLKLVPGAEETLELAMQLMPSYIISTSYRHYIEALCRRTGFPIENTRHTTLTLNVPIGDDEREMLMKLREEVIDGDFQDLDEIFFQKIPQMRIGRLLDEVRTVGGDGKRVALRGILSELGLTEKAAMYVGDSITDVEPLRELRGKGIPISFNGNSYALREAEVAVISQDARALLPLVDLHSRFGRNYVMEFVKAYSDDPERALESFRVDFRVAERFENIFRDAYPTITPVDDTDELVEESLAVRKKIRGEDVGSLG